MQVDVNQVLRFHVYVARVVKVLRTLYKPDNTFVPIVTYILHTQALQSEGNKNNHVISWGRCANDWHILVLETGW